MRADAAASCSPFGERRRPSSGAVFDEGQAGDAMIAIRPRWLAAAVVLVTLAADPSRLLAGETPGKAAQPVDAKVRALVEKAVAAKNGEQQQAAFDAVINLDCAAVPALGTLLGDSRPLPTRYLRLENRATDAFEKFRQYGPETVTDAVAAILNHITGQHFGSIYNGATPSERDKAVAAWREFLTRTPAERLCGP